MIKNPNKYNCSKRKFRTTSEPLDIKWSAHSYTLFHITNNFRLPCVVRCHVNSCSLNWSDLHFELSEPLLLYSQRCIEKVKASVMKRTTDQNELTDTGSCVVIPRDYSGWFSVFADHSETILPSTTLESVACNNTDQVLVANSISCLCLTDSEKGSKKTERKQISAGEILQIKRTDVSGSRSSPTKYLVCTDEKDKEMYLPFSQNGKFYKVNKSVTDNGLFQIKDIICEREKFPLNIRHVIGDVPVFSSEYSCYLRCSDVIEEETVVGCTMDDNLLLLELQMKTPLKFYIALNDTSIKLSDCYSDALKNCEDEAEDYIRSIKFSFTLSPESSSVADSSQSLVDDVSLTESFYDTDSDFGEEDAQSEFTVKWDPTDHTNHTKSDKISENHAPKIFNSSINSAQNSTESNIHRWNEEPDTV